MFIFDTYHYYHHIPSFFSACHVSLSLSSGECRGELPEQPRHREHEHILPSYDSASQQRVQAAAVGQLQRAILRGVRAVGVGPGYRVPLLEDVE